MEVLLGLRPVSKLFPQGKKRWEVAIRHSLLRGEKTPFADWTHLLGKSAACLGSRLKMWWETLQPWHSPQITAQCWVFQVGSDGAATISLREITRYFRSLRQTVKGSGAEAVVSSVLPVIRNDQGRNRKSREINTWLWVELKDFWGFWSQVVLQTSGLLATGRTFLSQRGGEDLCTRVSWTHWKSFKLDLKGERD